MSRTEQVSRRAVLHAAEATQQALDHLQMIYQQQRHAIRSLSGEVQRLRDRTVAAECEFAAFRSMSLRAKLAWLLWG